MNGIDGPDRRTELALGAVVLGGLFKLVWGHVVPPVLIAWVASIWDWSLRQGLSVLAQFGAALAGP